METPLQFNLPAWLEPLVRDLEPWLPALTAIGVVMALASALAIPGWWCACPWITSTPRPGRCITGARWPG